MTESVDRQPLVGVVVPCHNQGEYAAECIASIEAQSWPHLRVVLIDDASTDDSSALCERLRSDKVDVLRLERNLGRAEVRNEGVRRLGEVDYVVNVDCDDALSPGYVEKLVRALEATPEAGLAYGTLRYFGEQEDPANPRFWPMRPYDPDRRFLEDVVPGPGTLLRSTALRDTRGWRVAFTKSGGEDYDLWLQIVEAGWSPIQVPDAIYHYRQHGGSFFGSADETVFAAIALNILRFHLAAIRSSIGVRTFLAPSIEPFIATSIRRHEYRGAARALGRLFRVSPADTVALLLRYSRARHREDSSVA